MKDYYRILEVQRGADQEEIRKAYRNLARRYHPDINKADHDAEARFKSISEAYEVLGNPEKRRRYDLFGEEGLEPNIFDRGFEGFGGPFGDILEMFFGRERTRSRRAPRRGSDLMMEIEIDLPEAFRGADREVEIPRNERCGNCNGTGLEKGYNNDLCPDCGGEGRITGNRRSPLGTFTTTTTCRRCGGTGEINTHPCRSCEGRGTRRTVDKLKVNIPEGISHGDRIRIAGKGEAGTMGAPNGDLYVQILVKEHETFRREGDNLIAAVQVSMIEATMGIDVAIPTLDGEEKLHIPHGSQPGDIYKMRGKGMPRLNSRARGDLYLTLNVRIPRKLTAEQKKLLRDYQRMEEQKKGAPKLVERLRKVIRTQP